MLKRLALILAIAALTASVAGAQEAEVFRHPPGTAAYILADTVQIVAAGKDTSVGFKIGGCDLFGYYVKYDSRNDSSNVKIYLDLSADGQNWVSWRSAAYDSVLTSGTADTERLLQLVNPPNYALWGRTRINGAHATGDTVKVTLKWNIHWLPQALNAF